MSQRKNHFIEPPEELVRVVREQLQAKILDCMKMHNGDCLVHCARDGRPCFCTIAHYTGTTYVECDYEGPLIDAMLDTFSILCHSKRSNLN